MKKYPAIAAVEFKDIAIGMYATDAMLKKSPIGFLKCGTITRGRYMTLFGGTPASVEESFNEGLFWGGSNVLDSVLLADTHQQLHDAILGARNVAPYGSLAIVETDTVCANIRAAELALKGTPVNLVEIRLADAGLSGKGVSIYQGDLSDVEAALEIVISFLNQRGGEVSYKIITQPHEALTEHLGMSTQFTDAKMVELDGEMV